jgi:hypothetical protein
MPKVAIQNVLQPGETRDVDSDRFHAMCTVVQQVVPPAPA